MPFSSERFAAIADGSRGLGRNVLAGLRLALFMRVRAEDFNASWAQLVALIALGIAVNVAGDLAFVGLKGQFSAYNLPGALFYVPVALVAAWALCALARRPEQTLTLLVALIALVIAIDVAHGLYVK